MDVSRFKLDVREIMRDVQYLPIKMEIHTYTHTRTRTQAHAHTQYV